LDRPLKTSREVGPHAREQKDGGAELIGQSFGRLQKDVEMMRELLSIESRQRNVLKRANLFASIEDAIKRNYFDDVEDAVAYARRKSGLAQKDEESMTFEQRKAIWLEACNDT